MTHNKKVGLRILKDMTDMNVSLFLKRGSCSSEIGDVIVSFAGGSGPWRLVKPGRILPVLCGLRRGAGKCVEISIPLLQKWRRYVTVTIVHVI